MKKIFCILGVFLVVSPMLADDVIVPPAAWNDYDEVDVEKQFYGSTSGTNYVYVTTDNNVLVAPVLFPPDATGYVYKLFATLYDFSTSGYIKLTLRKVNIINGSAYTTAEINTGASAASNNWVLFKKKASAYKAIDNTKYGWDI